MDFKSIILSFVIMLMSHANSCWASMLDGLYIGSDRWIVELAGDGSSEYKLMYGDIVQSAENCNNKELSICLNYDFVDILIPKKLEANVQVEYLGSVVTVNEYLPVMEFGNTLFKDVYKLTVVRSGLVPFEGEVLKRPGGKKSFEILYSNRDGLVGFRKLPGNREDFFIIDWRSLEGRRKK